MEARKCQVSLSLSLSHLDTVSFQEPGRVTPSTTQFPQYDCIAGTGEIYLQSCSAVVLCIHFVHWSIPHCHLYRFPGCSNLSSTHSKQKLDADLRSYRRSDRIENVLLSTPRYREHCVRKRKHGTLNMTTWASSTTFLMFESSTFTTSRIPVTGLRVPEKIEREWGTGWYSKSSAGGTGKWQQPVSRSIKRSFRQSRDGGFQKLV